MTEGLLTTADDKKAVSECYATSKWQAEINDLFPDIDQGCINFGYWKKKSNPIPLQNRINSQIELYNKLFSFCKLRPKSTILEVGCGRGHGVNLLLQKGYDAYGIDVLEHQINKCRKNYPNFTSRFTPGKAEFTGLKSQNFDSVISVEAAQHFSSFSDFALEVKRILKLKGKIGIATFFFTESSAIREVRKIIPSDVSGFHNAIEINKATQLLQSAGFQKIHAKPIGHKVFRGFSDWAEQSMRKKNHTTKWMQAYSQNLIDYYMVKAEKN